MASAKIGALNVSLGIDSAQFEAGLARAQGGIGRFNKMAGVAFAAVATAGVAAAGALGLAVKGAIDNADALSKASQKIGVTTEALSRLEWAAKLSDVSLDQLTGGLGKLSKSMLDVASGTKGPTKVAFDALGISVTDAAGKLRAADDVMGDIADRFSRLEDGSTKTALAMSLFGRSGAQLIPLLNQGRDGLRAMADESDRLGNTISTKTGRAAEQFNDNLTRLGAVFQGLTNKIMEGALPALVSLTNTMASKEFQEAVSNTIGLVTTLGDVLARTAVLAYEVANVLPKALNQSNDQAMAKMNEDFATMDREAFNRKYGLGDKYAPGTAGAAPAAGPGAADLEAVKAFSVNMDALSTSTAKVQTVIDPLAARIEELSGLMTMTADPFEQMKLDLTDLKTIFDEGRISAAQYGQAVSKSMYGAADSTLGSLSQISGALSSAFQDNKLLAAANAAINTAQGITKALAEGGPFGFPIAAAIGVAGAAQIAAIMSASPSGATAANVPSAAPVAAPTESSGPSIYLELKGSRFTRSDVEGLIKDINSAVKDGARLQVA